jgi:hypothetical protein
MNTERAYQGDSLDEQERKCAECHAELSKYEGRLCDDCVRKDGDDWLDPPDSEDR